jgi:hypothetical protein
VLDFISYEMMSRQDAALTSFDHQIRLWRVVAVLYGMDQPGANISPDSLIHCKHFQASPAN